MEKQKTQMVLLMQDIAGREHPFAITKEGHNVIYVDPEDMSNLLSRLASKVDGFTYHFSTETGERYLEIKDNKEGEVGRIYLRNRSEFKRF